MLDFAKNLDLATIKPNKNIKAMTPTKSKERKISAIILVPNPNPSNSPNV